MAEQFMMRNEISFFLKVPAIDHVETWGTYLYPERWHIDLQLQELCQEVKINKIFTWFM